MQEHLLLAAQHFSYCRHKSEAAATPGSHGPGLQQPSQDSYQVTSRTCHPADCQALSSHPARPSAPPASASPLLLLPRAESCNCSADISLDQQLFPWSGFFFGIMGQVAVHDYIEGRKWGTSITNPHVQAT